jgi:hypothetical protein
VWLHWTPTWGGLFGRARILYSPNQDSPVYDLTELFNCSVGAVVYCAAG